MACFKPAITQPSQPRRASAGVDTSSVLKQVASVYLYCKLVFGRSLIGRSPPSGEPPRRSFIAYVFQPMWCSRAPPRSLVPYPPLLGETKARELERREGKDWRQGEQWPSSCESQRMADGAQTDAIEPAWNSCCDACSCSDAVRQQGWQTLQELRRQKDIFTDGQVWLVWHSRQRG